MTLVKVVPELSKVFNWTSFQELHAVVNQRIDQADHLNPNQYNTSFVVTINVDLVGICCEANYVDEMDNSAKVVKVFCILVPLEGKNVLNDLAVENFELLSFTKESQQVVIAKTLVAFVCYDGEDVEGVLNLVDLSLWNLFVLLLNLTFSILDISEA